MPNGLVFRGSYDFTDSYERIMVSPKQMFWAALEDCPFRGVSLNANVVRFFIAEVEEVECTDIDRIERITMAIDGEIHMCLCSMEVVPSMMDLFLKHYRDPANRPKQRAPETAMVSDR